MKELLFLVIISLLLQGCTSKIEIPVSHAGVVIHDEHVKTLVLRPGEHLVSFGTRVIIYDVSQAILDSEFDFYFEDFSKGKLNVAIEFTPIVDSLSSFYRKYQSIYVTTVIEIITQQIVRDLFKNVKPNEFTKQEFELKIIKAIIENDRFTNYVNVKRVDIVDLWFD